MPYIVTSPDGKKFKVTPPAGATPEQINAEIQRITGAGQGKPPAMSTVPDIEAEQRALAQKEIAANQSIKEAKSAASSMAPAIAGALAAPFTAGMSLPYALGTQALVGGGVEAARQVAMGEDFDPISVGLEGGLSGGLEGVGRGMAWGLKAAKGLRVPKIDPDDAAVFAAAQRAGAPLTAAEVTGGPIKRLVQKWTDSSVFGEKLAAQRHEKISDAMSAYVSEAMDAVHPATSTEGTKEGARKLMQRVHAGWKKSAEVLYDEARALAPKGKVVDLGDAASAAKRLLERDDNLREVLPNVLKELTPEEKPLESFLRDAFEVQQSSLLDSTGKAFPPTITPKVMTVEQATGFRKLLNEKYYQYLRAEDRPAAAMFKKMGMAFDDTLAAQTGGLMSPYMKSLRHARAFYKEGADLWDTAVLGDLLKKNPSEALRNLNVRDPFTLKTLEKTFTRWGNVAEGRALVRRQAMQDMFADAQWSQGPELGVSPAKLRTAMKGLAPSAKQIIFMSDKQGIEVLRRMDEFVSIAERVNKTNPGQGDRLMRNIVMLGWGIAHASPAMVGAAGATALGPKMLAGIANHPQASIHLTRAAGAYQKALLNPGNPTFWGLYMTEAAKLGEITRRYTMDVKPARKARDAALLELQQQGPQPVPSH
jgi:hypothetical protein